MSGHSSKHIIAAMVFSIVLLTLPGVALAQFTDFPLPDPPNALGSNTPSDEPLLYTGNYCGAFAGASLHDVESQSLSVDVIGDPVAAFFFWSGRDATNATPDTSINISGNANVTQAVTANAALDAESQANFSWLTQSYDAVAGGFPVIETGLNTFTVSGLDFNERQHCVTVFSPAQATLRQRGVAQRVKTDDLQVFLIGLQIDRIGVLVVGIAADKERVVVLNG